MLLDYETTLWNKGHKFIAGVDEVGRGCLAGPIFAAAVVWDPDIFIRYNKSDPFLLWMDTVKDSKKLSKNRRGGLYEIIKKECLYFAIAEISNVEIDKTGIASANKKVLTKALQK